MKKKAIVSLFAACVLLLSACGGSGNKTEPAVQAPSDDSSLAMASPGGSTTSTPADTSTAAAASNPAETQPTAPAASAADVQDFVGLWAYDGESLCMELREDGTWALYNELGGAVSEGTWMMDSGAANLYNEGGNYYVTLEIAGDGMLSDGFDNTLLSVQELTFFPSAADAPTYDEDLPAMVGFWYPDGKLDAESYLYIEEDGSWSMYRRAPGKEPWMEDSGTIVSAQGEYHAYYAESAGGQSAFYFQFTPASQSSSGSPEILWNNGEALYIWCE
ncbi:MAG: hypothetical protein E7425_02570 [Ruminococcaceae bacterium]|jgi:hypothetical protein|nr:hypothetical protein [Oscillospiraceae bacterium]